MIHFSRSVTATAEINQTCTLSYLDMIVALLRYTDFKEADSLRLSVPEIVGLVLDLMEERPDLFTYKGSVDGISHIHRATAFEANTI